LDVPEDVSCQDTACIYLKIEALRIRSGFTWRSSCKIRTEITWRSKL